jgi:hypothetical protein
MKTIGSDISGGLNRTAVLMDYNGDTIKVWEGKFDIRDTGSDNQIFFDLIRIEIHKFDKVEILMLDDFLSKGGKIHVGKIFAVHGSILGDDGQSADVSFIHHIEFFLEGFKFDRFETTSDMRNGTEGTEVVTAIRDS